MIKEKFIQGETKIVFEAGGILVRDADSRILIIHRKKYNDWTLPKGHIEKTDASPDMAALREVKEETGFEAEIISAAEVMSYNYKNELKIVIYFLMRPKGTAHSLSEEDKNDVTLEWLTTEEAITRLTFPQQKELIKNMFSLNPSQMILFKSLPYKRLEAFIDVFEIELKNLKQIKENKPTECFQCCDELVKKANTALKKRNYNLGWQSMHAAQRMLIETYDWAEIEAGKQSTRDEATKIKKEWRKNSINKLLDSIPLKPSGHSVITEAKKKLCESLITLGEESDGAGPVECLEKLFHTSPKAIEKTDAKDEKLKEAQIKLKMASLVLHTDFDNMYYKMEARKKNLMNILWVCIGAVVLIDVIACCILHPIYWPDYSMIFWVELFGILGAGFSIAYSFANKKIADNIPEELSGSIITIIRPIIGAVSGLVIYLFFLSGMVTMLHVDSGNNIAMMALAFISGFSERLVIKVAEAAGEKVK